MGDLRPHFPEQFVHVAKMNIGADRVTEKGVQNFTMAVVHERDLVVVRSV
jgi:hypothetical protein